MNDKAMAEIGRLAVAENELWKIRNAKRRALHDWLRQYRYDADGDYFDHESAEPEHRNQFDLLMAEKTEAQRKYSLSRAATRRCIVRHTK